MKLVRRIENRNLRSVFTLAGLFMMLLFASAATARTLAPQSWADIYPSYLSQGSEPADSAGLVRFNYKALKADAQAQSALGAYIEDLAALSPSQMDAPSAMAYWANLYNALTIQVVTGSYPVKSIRDIKSNVFTPGPWKLKLIMVEGEMLSLDDIEHEILRKKYPSPLIHYMVNCASIGCPNLPDHFWRPETLAADQAEAARVYIASPRGARVTPDGNLDVSSIYKWFEEDFGGSKEGVLAHLKTYGGAELVRAIDEGAKIKDYRYDWTLNDGPR